jgi:hypothetical protein
MNSKSFSSFISMVFMSLVGCGGVPLDPHAPAPQKDLPTGLGLEDIPYVRDDTFIGNPLALLGQIVEIHKKNGTCPTSATANDGGAEFSVEPLSSYRVDERSIISSPIKRDSQIITHDGAASVAFLNYLSTSLDANSVYSIILFDQAGGRVDDKDASWKTAIKSWMDAHGKLLQDPEVCYLWVVKGFVQKNVVRRKFTDVSVAAKGGAYGVNVEGKYHTSTDDYSVDVKFGLSPGILKRPEGVPQGLDRGEVGQMAPTESELKVLTNVTTIVHRKK